MRVLVVTSSYPLSESSISTPIVSSLCEELQRSTEANIVVLAPRADGVRRDTTVNGIDVRVVRYLPRSFERLFGRGSVMNRLQAQPLLWWQVPFFICALAWKMTRILTTETIDVVHSHWVIPQGAVVGLVNRKRLAHVATVHGGDVLRDTSWLLSAIRRFAIMRASVVTANGSVTEAAVKTVYPAADVRIIRQGVRANRFTRLDRVMNQADARISIGFVGRLVEEKGIFDVLDAIVLLVRDYGIDVRLEVIGDGNLAKGVAERVDQLSLSQRVRLSGWCTPEVVARSLASFDVVLCPSKRSRDGAVEAQGLVIGEAMLAGTPVVTTRSGGIVDYITHGRTGMLCAEGAPGELADAVATLVRNPQLARKIAIEAHRWASENITLEAAAARFHRIYQDVARESKR